MTVTSTTPATPAPAPAAATPAAKDKTALGRVDLASNFNTFLALLTTQLKNQDPLSPLDSNQFTQQLVQMTGVEQQINTNDLLKQLVSNTSGGVATAVSLIGKDVKAVSDTASISGGKAQWTYNLPAAAASVKVQVVDPSGAVVHVEAPSGTSAGDHDFTWNGKDQTGRQLADGGPYTLRVLALDASGAQIASTTYVRGVVTGVEQANGATLITINGGQVDWSKVTGITLPAAPTPAQSTATTSVVDAVTNALSNPPAGS
ncbi:MAG: flagellar hook assembly protein FlgD [Phenylobacterium sp.]